MVGLPPYSPDALIDVQIDDEGRVTILLADYFSRPLRLTPGQGLALLASSEALLSVPGTDPRGALARALDKLATAVGVERADAVDIKLGVAEESVLDQLRTAVAARDRGRDRVLLLQPRCNDTSGDRSLACLCRCRVLVRARMVPRRRRRAGLPS